MECDSLFEALSDDLILYLNTGIDDGLWNFIICFKNSFVKKLGNNMIFYLLLIHKIPK